MFDKSYWQAAEKYVADDATETRLCEMPGCAAGGDYRAPKSPDELRSYRWFCLPHIQEYNKAWDFYKGMGVDQMERVRREDVVGWRPTWPLGHLKANDIEVLRQQVLRRFWGQTKHGAKHARAANSAKANASTVTLTAEEHRALQRLNLQWPVSLYEVKQSYRALVKQHHPDTVAADEPDAAQKKRAADELIKLINRAYAVLKKKVSN
jgi:hypothetical protein